MAEEVGQKATQVLNHHSATVLPYHLDNQGRLHFVLEQKDPKYKPPFFDNGLNFFGGNWEASKNPNEISPEETAIREIREEFWQQYESPESLNDLLGQDFVDKQPNLRESYGKQSLDTIKEIGRTIVGDIKHAGDYIMRVRKPIVRDDVLSYGLTVFTKALSESKLIRIIGITEMFRGKLTKDNIKWGSKTRVLRLDEINANPAKFAWGYDQVMNDLLERRVLPGEGLGVIRPLSLVSAERVQYPNGEERTFSGSPTYQGFRRTGFSYKK